MSIESKQLMLHEINKALGGILTTDSSTAVMQVLTEIIGDYEIEKCKDLSFDVEGEELLNAYISAKNIEGRSPKTLERYRYIISRMMQEIQVPIRKISVFHIRNYFTKEKERGLSDRSLESTREVFSAFFGWLQKEGLIQSNPISNLGPIKYAKVQRVPYTQVDIEKLKEHCASERDKAIISFLLCTGCRISEVCALNRADIDFANLECVVMGKGEKERVVFLDEVSAMVLRRYLDSRKDEHEALFVGKGSERLTPGGVRAMLRRISASAGVDNTHPHRFRRTLATRLINHGMPIQEVATILGHDKIDTTMTYVYIDKRGVKNAYKQYA